ncbi:MAG: guanine deaminase [Candidatus Obscuribacterales bacterium]|nr:guanine deaminase [Candidatus Obscuribacterales bacterium]
MSKVNEFTAYRGHVISPRDFNSYDDFVDGCLLVDHDGKIVDVGDWTEVLAKHGKAAKVHEYGKRVIMPGFIDLHIHLVQIAQTGRSGDTLLGWLNKYIFPAEVKFARMEHATKLADWFFRELARNGTTLSSVFTSIHKNAADIAFTNAAERGCRVIMGKTLMDRNAPDNLSEDSERSLEESEELCAKWHNYDNGRLLYAFTPRFAPTSTKRQLEGAAELFHKYPGSYMQTHLSENSDEIAWVKELFPGCKNYLDVYASHGLIGKNSLFAHSIHLSDSEIDRLVESGSAAIHCPSSNLFLKSGVFPYLRAKTKGLKIGLGSDVAAGPEMSLFKVMKDAAYVQSELWLAPRELLYLATLSGAKAVNLDDQVGSLEKGKEADFIVVDPTLKSSVPRDILEQDADEILSSMVYVGDDRMVVETYVRGRAIYKAEESNERKRDALNVGS